MTENGRKKRDKNGYFLLYQQNVYDIMSVSELEQVSFVQSEQRMAVTRDFEEINKCEVRVVT